MLIWVTGLSGAGKTTTSKHLVELLRADGLACIHLDGDVLRGVFFQDIDNPHTIETRKNIARAYSKLCYELSRQDIIVVMSTISLFHEIQEWNRENIKNYYEVFLDVPLDILIHRNQKGLYAKYILGDEGNIYGLDIKYEKPSNADLTISYSDGLNACDCAKIIYDKIRGALNGY